MVSCAPSELSEDRIFLKALDRIQISSLVENRLEGVILFTEQSLGPWILVEEW